MVDFRLLHWLRWLIEKVAVCLRFIDRDKRVGLERHIDAVLGPEATHFALRLLFHVHLPDDQILINPNREYFPIIVREDC